jgi:hypothetical protein
MKLGLVNSVKGGAAIEPKNWEIAEAKQPSGGEY